MDPQVVQHDLARWRHDFASGHIKPGWRGPRLEPEERLAANLGTVVVDDEDLPSLEMGLLVSLDPDGLRGPVSGTAFATNERLVVEGHHDHDHAWRFTDIYSVYVMARGAAVVVQQYAEDDRITLVGPPSGRRMVHGGYWIPTTDPQNRLSLWLRVEAAFVAASGTEALDAWFAELPNRLATL